MYTPKHFQAENRAAELQLIANYPLATVVNNASDGLDANLLPLYWFDDDSACGVLRGHVARANLLWQAQGENVVVIFQSENHYISPSFYPGKASDPRVVPTWNYSAVQVNGVLTVLAASELLSLLGTMTARHEAGRDPAWQISDAPAQYIERLMAAIVGIEIKIDRIAGKFKQSQNQSAENQAGIRAALVARL
ncbi:FMN-binding negative transcriptional regulator [Chitinibacter sp. S2-10]|uniref:FMN-binding negative transcriptional regulator n=1 Tax=Chitinibacter sp. S2-10 TaxID=3373597 RepID=UPI00397776CB